MMKIGDMVTIIRCGVCEKMVGKTAKIKAILENENKFELQFGRGRPQTGRPALYNADQISLVGLTG